MSKLSQPTFLQSLKDRTTRSISVNPITDSKDFEDQHIGQFEITNISWSRPNLDNDREVEEYLPKIEEVTRYLIPLIDDEVTSSIGLSLAFQIARNLMIESSGDRKVYIISQREGDPRWKTTAPTTITLDDMIAHYKDLHSFVTRKAPSVTIVPRVLFASRADVRSGKDKLAYIGMFCALLARSLVKEKVSMGYLFDKKLDAYFAAFHGAMSPYLRPVVPNSVLTKACNHAKYLAEGKTLIFTALWAFTKYASEMGRRVLGACILQALINFGLPAVGWADKASSMAKLSGGLNEFLGLMLHPKTKDSVNAVGNYCIEYISPVDDDGRKVYVYHYIAKFLDSSYFKQLGRDQNASFIVACYCICYYCADSEERNRLSRYRAPADPEKFGKLVLRSFVHHKKATLYNSDEFLDISMIKNDQISGEIRLTNSDIKEIDSIYEDAMGTDYYEMSDEEEEEEEKNEQPIASSSKAGQTSAEDLL